MKKLYAFIFILLMIQPAITYSDELKPKTHKPLHHQKRYYMSPEGRFFVPAGMKLFLKVTTSLEKNAPGVILKSENSQKKQLNSGQKVPPQPFMFKKSGQHKIAAISNKTKRSSGSQPYVEEQFFVNLDEAPPVSSVTVSKVPNIELNQAKVFGKSVQFRLKVFDNSSGLQGLYFSINGKPYSTYQQPLVFSKERDYQFRYYSVDNVGNIEPYKRINFSVDLTPPSSKHEIKTDHVGKILSPRSNFIIHSSDNNAGVAKISFGFDNERAALAMNTTQKKISTKKLSEGNHIFYYSAEDRVKNSEAKKTYAFYLDRTPPSLSISIQGDSAKTKKIQYVSKRSKIQINAKDNKSSVKKIHYGIDAKKNWQTYGLPFPVKGKRGVHNLLFYAFDGVGNRTKTYTYRLHKDIQHPTTNHQLKGYQALSQNRVFITSKTDIILKASDKESGVQKTMYNIDSQKEKDYKKPIYLKGDGQHQLNYYSLDRVNNNEKKRTTKFYVDNVPPVLFVQLSIGKIGTKQKPNSKKILDVYPISTMMFFGATDQSVGLDRIEYQINNKPVKTYGNTLVFNKTGEYVVKIIAFDKLQNKKTEIRHFFIN